MNLRERLAEAEGDIPHAYQDGEGWWTIGIGRLIDERKGGGLSEDEIQYLLTNDISKKTMECKKLFPEFDTFGQTRQEALIELMFNIGYGHISTYSHFIDQINSRHWAAARDNMNGWTKWIAQVGPSRSGRLAAAIGNE